MQLTNRTILITGGSSGIGQGLAKVLHQLGNQVIVTGRRKDRLEALCQAHPGMQFFVMDVSKPESIRQGVEQTQLICPKLDVLINNSGIQRNLDLLNEELSLEALGEEIDTNLNGLIWTTAAFLPLLKQNTPASIVNVSSGLGYSPLAMMPVYGATKAAVNSLSLSLRHQLRDSQIQVINLAPPAVESELDQGRRGSNGPPVMTLDSFVEAAIQALQSGEEDIAIGMAEQLRQGSRSDPAGTFARMNP